MTVTVFGNLILVNTDVFHNFLLSFKNSRRCVTTFPSTEKRVENTRLRVVFSTLFSVFGNAVEHCLSGTFDILLIVLHKLVCVFLFTNRLALHPRKQVLATVSDDWSWKMWAVPR